MSDTPDFDLQTFFPYHVRVFYRAVSETVKEIYSSRYGLTVDEWRTMANLQNLEPLSAKEIVKRSSIGKVNVSRAIASLQDRGLLERHVDPTDRRRALLRLTPKGRKVMRELLPLLLDAERRLLDGLSDDERRVMVDMMARIRAKADEMRSHSIDEETTDD